MDNLLTEKRPPGNPNMRKGGPSVNPRGAPKKIESLAQAAREAVTPADLAKKMLRLADSAESEQVRYQALAWLADRAHGKVTSEHAVTVSQGEDGPRLRTDLTIDEQREALVYLDKLLVAPESTETGG